MYPFIKGKRFFFNKVIYICRYMLFCKVTANYVSLLYSCKCRCVFVLVSAISSQYLESKENENVSRNS